MKVFQIHTVFADGDHRTDHVMTSEQVLQSVDHHEGLVWLLPDGDTTHLLLGGVDLLQALEAMMTGEPSVVIAYTHHGIVLHVTVQED